MITTLANESTLARRVAIRHHDARVGGSIPGLGSFNTVTLAPNVGSPRLSCPSIRYSRFVTNTGLQ